MYAVAPFVIPERSLDNGQYGSSFHLLSGG